MGATYVTATIRNPAEPERAWEGVFLVDTGAHDTIVPRSHLEAIGLRPKRLKVYELADGSTVRMEVAGAEVETLGQGGDCTVAFGDDSTEPMLGVIALESIGAEVDPVNECLKLLPTRLAVGARSRRGSESELGG